MVYIYLKPEQKYFSSSGNGFVFPGRIWATLEQMHKHSRKQTQNKRQSTDPTPPRMHQVSLMGKVKIKKNEEGDWAKYVTSKNKGKGK